MSHNKYYGTGLPLFSAHQLNSHLKKVRSGPNRTASTGPNSLREIRTMQIIGKRKKKDKFNALDALNIYLNGEFSVWHSPRPCFPEFFKAICSMITPAVARALYYRACGRYGTFERGSAIYHALGRELGAPSERERMFLYVMRDVCKNAMKNTP